MDRAVLLMNLNLLRRAIIVELEHAEVLRAGVEDGDAEARTRGRRGIANAREMVCDLLAEIDRELRDAAEAAPRTASPDGYLGAVES